MRFPVFAALLISLSAFPLASKTSDANSVVARASSAVCDKQVVILAELPSHGEARAFAIKADIVQALVQRCGFKAVLFEAPIYDFVGLASRWGKGTAQPRQLDQAIGRFWWARELSDWRRWLFQQADAGRLLLGGVDDQISVTSEHARAALPPLVAGLVSSDAAFDCQTAVERNLTWSYDATHPFGVAEKERLHRCTRDAAIAAQAGTAPPGNRQVMAINLAGYVERQVELDGAVDRDSVMYRNTQWYLTQMPADTKLIIWTATVHGSKQQGERKDPTLGALLQAQLGERLGVIGFTALGGESSIAGQAAKNLEQAPPDSLEHRALHSDADLAYLDSSGLAALGVVESRLLGKLSRADWSTRFDGVIVVARETPASFEAQP